MSTAWAWALIACAFVGGLAAVIAWARRSGKDAAERARLTRDIEAAERIARERENAPSDPAAVADRLRKHDW